MPLANLETSDRQRLGLGIRRVISIRGWTIVDLAMNANVDLRALSRLIRGQHILTLNVIFQLAKALKMAPGEFLDEINKEG